MLDNRLLTPSNNNASYYINSLETLDPENTGLRLLKSELSSSLLIESRKATLDNRFAEARRLINSAKQFGAANQLINRETRKITELQDTYEAAEQKRIQAEQRQRDQALQIQREEAQRRAAEQARNNQIVNVQNNPSNQSTSSTNTVASPITNNPTTTNPVTTNSNNTTDTNSSNTEATSTSNPTNEAPPEEEIVETEPEVDLNAPINVRLSQLTLQKQTEARYPRRYARRELEGRASVRFRVNKDGTTSNVSVINITPADADGFGTAAVKAVEDWEFTPYRDSEGNIRIVDSQVAISFKQ